MEPTASAMEPIVIMRVAGRCDRSCVSGLQLVCAALILEEPPPDCCNKPATDPIGLRCVLDDLRRHSTKWMLLPDWRQLGARLGTIWLRVAVAVAFAVGQQECKLRRLPANLAQIAEAGANCATSQLGRLQIDESACSRNELFACWPQKQTNRTETVRLQIRLNGSHLRQMVALNWQPCLRAMRSIWDGLQSSQAEHSEPARAPFSHDGRIRKLAIE